MIPTPAGNTCVRRLRSASREFQSACDAYRNMAEKSEHDIHVPLFRMDVSNQRLHAFIALHECRDPKRAADRLGVTPHAIYRTIHYLQDQLDVPLFERSAGGVLDATPISRVLLSHIKLAFAEIRHAVAELESTDGVVSGRVSVGTLPPARNVLIPRVINRVLETHPQIHLSILDGDLPSLETALRAGDIDMAVGTRLSSSDYSDVIFHPIMDAPFFVIARVGHPLAAMDAVTPNQLSAAKWLLPPIHTPQRRWAERFLEEKGAGMPSDYVDAFTYEIIEEVIADSDRLAFATIFDIERFERRTPLVVLPVDELLDPDDPSVPRVLNVVTRAHTTMSPAAKVFYRTLMDVARELEASARASFAKRMAARDSKAQRMRLVGEAVSRGKRNT